MKKILMKKDMGKTWYFDRTLMDYFDFCAALGQMAHELVEPEQTPVFLCIGSDRITGDCLGPLVGHKLKNLYPHCDNIYGTLAAPVHAKNIDTYLEEIYRQHDNPFLVAIDAALGIHSHIGSVTLSRNSLVPGEGVQKKLPSVGDISVTGIVNVCNGNTNALLQNTRLHLVNELSDFIFMGISNGFSSYFIKE